MLKRCVAVIMAGGKGERFWPKSTASRPKQFLALWGEGTLLQQAFRRASRLAGGPGAVFVVTGPDYVDLVREQLPDLPFDNLIIEPAARDTAPAIGYAVLWVERRVPEAVMVVIPSDHVILDEDRFVATLRYAAHVAATGEYLVTVGIKPTRPEEGYGYIEYGDEYLAECSGEHLAQGKPGSGQGQGPGGGSPGGGEGESGSGAERAFRVKRFTEKPDLRKALEFIRGGRHLWNAGMFAWQVTTIRAALERHAPGIAGGLRTIEGLLTGLGLHGLERVREIFLELDKTSIDYAVLEKADNILVVPADFGWDDVGTWTALERIRDHDENGNVVQGRAVLVDASGNIVENSSGDKMLVAFGVDDLVIVNTDDVVLIADKRKSGSLKKLSEVLKRAGEKQGNGPTDSE
ncbi:MAG TPA: NTP transferase domain-containing protein [Firmicutes bacterium]|nr:NTP transferase domain-containing protein [Bacillota bacterium]